MDTPRQTNLRMSDEWSRRQVLVAAQALLLTAVAAAWALTGGDPDDIPGFGDSNGYGTGNYGSGKYGK